MAAALDEEALRMLAAAQLEPVGFIAKASNHTLLVRVGPADAGMHGIYKPRAGERPLWDFPRGTLCQREVAAYLVSDFLGWDVVPPTVMRDGPMGEGSVQLFVDHDPRAHYFVLAEEPAHHQALVGMAVFDLLVNNADRKAGHVLLGPDGRIRGCDHGLTFHVQPKLRTVIWEFGDAAFLPRWCADLDRLCAALVDPHHPFPAALAGLLSATELAMLGRRAGALQRSGRLPAVGEDGRSYPWPPL
jgi:uncharacterized repeat protein (TIGR03843 family)